MADIFTNPEQDDERVGDPWAHPGLPVEMRATVRRLKKRGLTVTLGDVPGYKPGPLPSDVWGSTADEEEGG
jgi:hypothetical protein